MRHIELTPREVLIAILRRWKMVVLLGLTLAILVGGYSYLTQSQGMGELQETYQAQLASYHANLAAKQSGIEQNTAIADAAEKYNSNSLLMTVDPYNKVVANLTFSVSVKPDSFNLDLANQRTLGFVDLGRVQATQLVSRYLILANSANLGELFSGLLPQMPEDTYLREMVFVSRYAQEAKLEGDEGLVTIQVTGTKDFDAGLAAHKMYEFLQGKQPLLEETITPHTLTLLEDATITSVDNELATKQAEQRSIHATAVSQITTLRNEIEELHDKKPSEPSLWKYVLKNALFAFVLGLIIGLVIAVFLYLSKFPLQYALQVQDQLKVPFLGGVKPKKGYLLTGYKNKLAGDGLLLEEKEALNVVAANLGELVKPGSSILLSGGLTARENAEVAKKLNEQLSDKNITVLPGDSLGSSAQTVRALAETQGVVLLERLDDSRLKRVLSDKERLELMDKPLLGYMLA